MSLDPKVEALKGFLDYDRPHFAGLDAAQRVDYFEKRVRLVVIRPLRRLLDTEIIVDGSSAILIFGVSLCCAIEATGHFLTGQTTKGRYSFDAFVKRYMSRDFSLQLPDGTLYRQALWRHFRNGIAHGFSVKHGGFEGDPTQPYFLVRQIAGHECLEINPARFYDDYVSGFDGFLADLRGAPPGHPTQTRFNDVFELVFVKGN
ncbi:MAG: hypothetical protein Q7R30_16625 [Acidobacteriota bacterium]|nr:hypothetical protein [Acidobacteriota bacterium]